jgi:hypothetical protein
MVGIELFSSCYPERYHLQSDNFHLPEVVAFGYVQVAVFVGLTATSTHLLRNWKLTSSDFRQRDKLYFIITKEAPASV